MKTIVLVFCAGFTIWNVFGQVGIGTVNPTESSMLEVSSTSDGGITYRGLMPPRVSTVTERDAINANTNDTGLLVFVQSISCLQMWNGINWESVHCSPIIPTEPWINEFHYDNLGTDTGEFIEIAGPAGLDLSNYRILFYDGADGLEYPAPLLLNGIIDNESNNFGAISFPRPNIQNGTPDGFALINEISNEVIQFISYEGTFMANDGLANGMNSIDIGFFEDGTDSPGNSLQLTGTGNTYGDFLWNPPSTESPGSLNVGQIIN
jgi:hypothetical protein